MVKAFLGLGLGCFIGHILGEDYNSPEQKFAALEKNTYVLLITPTLLSKVKKGKSRRIIWRFIIKEHECQMLH